MSSSKTIEQTYVKKNPIQHIKDCPDTYVGSMDLTDVNLWTFDKTTGMMLKKDIIIIPALYKIFDEILVNVYDQYIRSRHDATKEKVSIIKVNVDVAANEISIYNNGEGIPVAIHQEHNKYVAEMIFGDLLTSSNYDKDEKKITGGKNGFGAKLANIFSTRFIVETVDRITQKKYVQEFRNNMEITEKPKITKATGKPYVKITFNPDFKFLGKGDATTIPPDMEALFLRRVYDMMACTDDSVTVYWNEEKLGCKAFEKYVDLYIGPKTQTQRVTEVVNDRWELVVCPSADNNLEHISFVNGIYTYRGGEHVDYIATQVARKLVNFLKKKKKNAVTVKESYIKDNMMVFLKCSIENPSFSSQTKEYMTTVAKNFGSKCNVSDQFIEKLSKIGIVEKAMKLGDFKDAMNLDKVLSTTSKSRPRIPKYEPANWAGTNKYKECILILTEGDSAKSSVEAAFNVVGRDKFGIFPLKGKLLNVRNAALKTIADNTEINNIREIMGLQFKNATTQENMVYDEELIGLNYGKIMIMADQDHDGSHIKGLLMNYIEAFWPSLFAVSGFITSFKTPIVVVTKKVGNKDKIQFFNMTNYLKWKDEVNINQWTVKYYKGLGTSNRTDFQDYFKDYEKHYMEFHNEEEDGHEAITLAFDDERADDRKLWLGNYDKNLVVDVSENRISYKEFIDKDLIHFSNYDNVRSIPNICDGLKPSQRKVMYYLLCKIRSECVELKVAQLAGSVASKTDYHHGETSMMDTIINMAQNFVGANNINLLYPSGQFGTRRMNGKDSASARYIYTYLEPIARILYNKDDLALLNYNYDDSEKEIEPEWFLPILPMVLINGCEGIGTGYSTFIYPHNPIEIVANIRRLMAGEEPVEMAPYFRGYKGNIFKDGGKYHTQGTYTILPGNVVEITELPLGMSIEHYKTVLDELMIDKTEKVAGKLQKQCVTDFMDNSTDVQINFKVKFSPVKFKALVGNDKTKLEKLLKLTSSGQTKDTFMHLFNAENKMTKYDKHLDILKEFYEIRLKYYQKRYDYLFNKYKDELDIIKEKIRFIELFITDKLKLINQDDSIIVASLEAHNFIKMKLDSKNKNKNKNNSIAEEDAGEDNDVDNSDVNEVDVSDDVKKAMMQYNYLIGMSIRTLTKKRMEELQNQKDAKQILFDEISNKTTKEMWNEDLEEFLIKYEEMMEQWHEKMEHDSAVVKQTTKTGGTKKGGVKKIVAGESIKKMVKTVKVVK